MTGDPLEHPLLAGARARAAGPGFDGAYLAGRARGPQGGGQAVPDGPARRRRRRQHLRHRGAVPRRHPSAPGGGQGQPASARPTGRRRCRQVLGEAIRQGGTTLRDYVNADGTPGYFRQKLYVYERAGQPCRRCGTPIRQLVQGQRSTYFCPACQSVTAGYGLRPASPVCGLSPLRPASAPSHNRPMSAPAAPKRVLLGVTGGIAAYKSAELVRRLREQRRRGAGRDDGGRARSSSRRSRSRRCRAGRCAPTCGMRRPRPRWATSSSRAGPTASWSRRRPPTSSRASRTASPTTCSRTLCLATDAPIAVAPAMNRLMWANAGDAGQRRDAARARRHDPRARARASRPAAKPAPAACSSRPRSSPTLSPRATCRRARSRAARSSSRPGPTRERIDPVRFITNRSSGKMGYAVAEAARDAGAEVVLVSGPGEPADARRRAARRRRDRRADDGRGARAICRAPTSSSPPRRSSDYRPAQAAAEKIKKTSDSLMLALSRTPDILATVAARLAAAVRRRLRGRDAERRAQRAREARGQDAST